MYSQSISVYQIKAFWRHLEISVSNGRSKIVLFRSNRECIVLLLESMIACRTCVNRKVSFSVILRALRLYNALYSAMQIFSKFTLVNDKTETLWKYGVFFARKTKNSPYFPKNLPILHVASVFFVKQGEPR